MRRTVIIVPEWLATDPGETVFDQKLPTLQTMAELGTIAKLNPLPPTETPEAVWLGMRPDEAQMRQGPLTVAALGADPPERSTHFHLSLMSYEDGRASKLAVAIPNEVEEAIFAEIFKLNTKKLTIVRGQGVDHGLVWEAVGDIGDHGADELDGKAIKGFLPEGDGETTLRRLIDDSVNLLSGLPINDRRREEGLPPINLLWPWGNGRRVRVPNLALRRGEPVTVQSNSLRLQGLARLAGYGHEPRDRFGSGTNTRLEWIAENCLVRDASITLLDGISGLKRGEKLEEARWLTHEIDRRLLAPLFERALKDSSRIAIVAPSEQSTGLSLVFETGDRGAGSIPFGEEALEARRLEVQDSWTAIDRALLPPDLVGQ